MVLNPPRDLGAETPKQQELGHYKMPLAAILSRLLPLKKPLPCRQEVGALVKLMAFLAPTYSPVAQLEGSGSKNT